MNDNRVIPPHVIPPYRGKEIRDNTWAYGHHLENDNKHYIIPNNTTVYEVESSRELIIMNYERVRDDTVGRCTRLTANESYRGTNAMDLLMYEGDVVVHELIKPTDIIANIARSDAETPTRYVTSIVTFDDESSSFKFTAINNERDNDYFAICAYEDVKIVDAVGERYEANELIGKIKRGEVKYER